MLFDQGARRITTVLSKLNNPSLFLPQAITSHLSVLPPPLAAHDFPSREFGRILGFEPRINTDDIRAVILDKDNTFTKSSDPKVHPSCLLSLAHLSSRYKSLIVSNSAGSAEDAADGYTAAKALEDEAQIEVLRHATYKPLEQILSPIQQWISKNDLRPEQICLIGDNVFTDILTANMLGCWSVLLLNNVTANPLEPPIWSVLKWPLGPKYFQCGVVFGSSLLGFRPQRPGAVSR